VGKTNQQFVQFKITAKKKKNHTLEIGVHHFYRWGLLNHGSERILR